MNEMVMNFLVVEGYKDAAVKFNKECNSGVSFTAEHLLFMEQRMCIKNAIFDGNVDYAICMINDLNPEVIYCTLV